MVGVLALQGDFEAHAQALARAGAVSKEVRAPADMAGLQGLIIPGGESTTLLRLLRSGGMDQAILRFHRQGGALLGTCAGLILLATQVTDPSQESLGLCDVQVRRNGFGRQIDSFLGRGRLCLPGEPERISEMVFIRAPRISGVGRQATVLGWLDQEPVLVATGRVLAATFHPEMSADNAVHSYFARLASNGRGLGGEAA